MNDQPEKITGASMDISTENRARLKQLFPIVFTETRNDKGELVESIDFEKLKAELGTFTDLFEGLPEQSAGSRIDFGRPDGEVINELGIGNSLMLAPEQILKNLHGVQSRNNVPKSRDLFCAGDSGITTYNFPNFSVEMETGTEEEIAKLLDSDERVKFFCKLPRWFKVTTPLGDYNPDWAVVVEDSQKLYLVRETKNTLDRDKRRERENKKVDCGKAHFKALGVNFKDAVSIYEVLQP